jgi:hypothetical protein
LSVVASLIAVAPAIARAARLKPGDVLITDDKFNG